MWDTNKYLLGARVSFRHRLNRHVVQLTTRTLVDNRTETGARIDSFEGFPSLVIAPSVDKCRLDRLITKAKLNFVSADTTHYRRAGGRAGSLQRMTFFTELPVAAVDGRSQRAKLAGGIALKRSN